METPLTVEPIEINDQPISTKDIKYKKTFIKEDKKLIIFYTMKDKVIFLTIEEKENKDYYKYELNFNFQEIKERITYFKLFQNIEDIYKVFIQLFESDKYYIKKENGDVKLIIILINILGKEEHIELFFNKIDIDDKTKIDLMENKIKQLENQIIKLNEDKNIIEEKMIKDKKEIMEIINKLLDERKHMEEKIKELVNENILIKEEMKK